MKNVSQLFRKPVTKWIVGLILVFSGLSYLVESVIGGLLILLSAVFVLPPVYRWLSSKLPWSLSRKVRAVLVAVLFFAGIILGGSRSSDVQIAASKTPTPGATASQGPTATPTPKSEEGVIHQLVTEKLEGNNNMGKPRMRNLSIVKLPEGWNVVIEFNADDNLTKNLRKKGTESDMGEIYIALYGNGGLNIQNVTISAFFPLVDRYGNESDGIVYKTSLGASEASKVNWDADDLTLRASILPNVWITILLRPGFQ